MENGVYAADAAPKRPARPQSAHPSRRPQRPPSAVRPAPARPSSAPPRPLAAYRGRRVLRFVGLPAPGTPETKTLSQRYDVKLPSDRSLMLSRASAEERVQLHLEVRCQIHQLDTAERGFSFMRDGPLDMRMDQSSGGGALTAATILNEWPAKEIANVIWRYGEERASRRIAQAIVAARPLGSTADLAAALKAAAPPGPPKLASKMAARVFQALRIAVNGELDELDAVLSAAAALVRPGGRLAVLSYHSLEDRRVKRLLRSGTLDGDAPPTDLYGKSLAVWAPVTRQPITASDDEVNANPRARSARLRVGERTEVPLSG